MADLYGPEVRSWVMSRIRKRDTKPELLLRAALRRARVSGWRSLARLPGTPDVAFPRAKLAIFVDGCFWHACSRCAIPIPRSNRAYWGPKIARNVRRDRRVRRQLRALGWATLTVREHEVLRCPEKCVAKIQRRLSTLDSATPRPPQSGRAPTLAPSQAALPVPRGQAHP